MRRRHSILIGLRRRGIILLLDENSYVVLNPMERTLYRLFLSPLGGWEGINQHGGQTLNL